VATGLIAPPKKDFGSHWANASLNGWKLSLLQTYATPQGVDPFMSVTACPMQSKTQFFLAQPSAVSALDSPPYQRVPFLPRSSLKLGTTLKTDLRATKDSGCRRKPA